VYTITYKEIAAEEYAEAIEWYAGRSKLAAENFIAVVEEKPDNISKNPKRYKNIYKAYYETPLSKYPYVIVYSIDEPLTRVVILAVYHTSRSPRKKYRK